jgi:hypothetical protein
MTCNLTHPGELTPSAARELTERINTTSQDLCLMLQSAHDGKAWLALGYGTWNEYLAVEIKLSKQHAHRLLAFAETRQLIEKSPMGDLPPPTSERQVRALAKLPPQDRASVYAKAVKVAGGSTPVARQVEDAVKDSLGMMDTDIQTILEGVKNDPLRSLKPRPAQVYKYGLDLPRDCPGILFNEADKDGQIVWLGRFAVIAPLAHDRGFVFTAWLEYDDFGQATIVGDKKARRAGFERDIADFMDSWPAFVSVRLEKNATDEATQSQDWMCGPWDYNRLLYASRTEWLGVGLGITKPNPAP